MASRAARRSSRCSTPRSSQSPAGWSSSAIPTRSPTDRSPTRCTPAPPSRRAPSLPSTSGCSRSLSRSTAAVVALTRQPTGILRELCLSLALNLIARAMAVPPLASLWPKHVRAHACVLVCTLGSMVGAWTRRKPNEQRTQPRKEPPSPPLPCMQTPTYQVQACSFSTSN